MIAYPTAGHGHSVARRIAGAVPPRRPDRGAADYPVTTERDRPPRRLRGRAARVLRRCARPRSRAIWTPVATWPCCARATRSSTAPTCTCTSAWRRRYATEVVPGVTSFCGRRGRGGHAAGARDEVLTVLPGTLDRRRAGGAGSPHERRRGGDEARPRLRRRARRRRAGRRGRARRLRRAGERRTGAGRAAARRRRRRRRTSRWCSCRRRVAGGQPGIAARGVVSVVGLGPAGTATGSRPRRRPSSRPPTTSSATAPYLERVPPSGAGSGGTRSDNRVEAERARATRSRWRPAGAAGGGGVLRRPRASSPWPRRARGARRGDERRRRGARGARGCRRCRRPRRGSARRSATTSA